MFEEPDEVIARIDQDVARAQRRAERLGELQSRLADVRGVARSRQGDIAVEVDRSGALTGVKIAESALGRGGQRLSAELVALAGQAKLIVQSRMAEATAEVLDEDDPVATLLLDSVTPERESGLHWPSGMGRRG